MDYLWVLLHARACFGEFEPMARTVELPVRLPSARSASSKSTWAFCQTRVENGGTIGASIYIILAGEICTSITFEKSPCSEAEVYR
jgi:hypothetical protein